MIASRVEFRFRFFVQGFVYLFAFLAVPAAVRMVPALADTTLFTQKSTWLVLSSLLARQGWLTFTAATVTLLLVSLMLTGLAAWFRVWGTAYLGPGVTLSGALQARTLVWDGPYRRTRNPLYLGTLLHTLGIALLMPPAGAVFAIAITWLLQLRLALAEEAFLAQRFASAYAEYKAGVPRFLPGPAHRVHTAGKPPQWVQGMLGELYFVAAFLVLAALGWSFNAQPILQGLLISAGAWLVVAAFLPGRPAGD